MNAEKAEANSRLLELSKRNLENKTKKELEQKQKQEEQLEQRRIIMKSLLTPDAHARCKEKKRPFKSVALEREAVLEGLAPPTRVTMSRIAIVKEEKARRIEDIIIRNSQMGLLHRKIDDEQLIKIIEQVSEQIYKKEPVIEIRRRKQFDDDDDFNEEDYT
ncbi:apoptosis-like protein [Plasmodium vivax India VII]|uniref:Apoptosis-like protein n=2 Tax=Plasmodium vivax TaxID=5855 RepID=A0A0J9TFL5_PLAVI|nr:apoptosis-like protein [Plasmodium vivax India VII]KMZ93901.1 apoptosis-like protein [Plasmodium vivax Mauritania I]